MRLLPLLLTAALHCAFLAPARASNASDAASVAPALIALDETNYMDYVSTSEYLLVEV